MQGGDGSQQQKQQAEAQQRQEEMKHSILSQILDQQARARREFDLTLRLTATTPFCICGHYVEWVQ